MKALIGILFFLCALQFLYDCLVFTPAIQGAAALRILYDTKR